MTDDSQSCIPPALDNPVPSSDLHRELHSRHEHIHMIKNSKINLLKSMHISRLWQYKSYEQEATGRNYPFRFIVETANKYFLMPLYITYLYK